MLVMVVFFIAFRWIHLSTPLIRLFLLVLILLLMPTLNFLPVWFALSLLRFRLPSRLPMMFILWMVAMMVVIILVPNLNFFPFWFRLSFSWFRTPFRMANNFYPWIVALNGVYYTFRNLLPIDSLPLRRANMFLLVSWFGLTLPLLNAADWF